MSYCARSIVVLNVSWNTTQKQLVDEFTKYGKVLSINYINGKTKKKPGHCYIEFSCIKDVDNVIDIILNNNILLNNRVLDISQFKKNREDENDALVWQQKIESTQNRINIISDELTWQQKELLENNLTEQQNEKDNLKDNLNDNLNDNFINELKENIQKEKLKSKKFKYDNDRLKKENRLLKQIIDRNTENIRK